MNIKSIILSIESQKGINDVQWCSLENQKGIITVPYKDCGHSFRLVLKGTYLNGINALLALSRRATPHEDNSTPDKNKAQPLPTRTTIPRTIPHQDS